MERYTYSGYIEKYFEELEYNYIFNSSFRNKKDISDVFFNWSFEEIWEKIVKDDNLERGLLRIHQDIIYCMNSEYNDNQEDVKQIYQNLNFVPSSGEKPVFFVDSTIFQNRKKGTLFTTKGVYVSKKAPIYYTDKMRINIKESMKELYLNGKKVLSVSSPRRVFEDAIDLFNIVFLFNCIRKKK